MMFNGSMPSLSDIAAVTDKNNGDGWGNGNGWWVLIILFALFGGWGNGGYGNGNGGNYGTQAEVQRGFDTQAIISKLDGINSGICSLGYDQLAQMNGINTNIMQGTNTLSNAICSLGYNFASGQNALSSQLAQCCCNQEKTTLENRYIDAKNTCDIVTAINQVGQNIMNNDNANYRQLHDEFIEYRLAAKDAEIARQNNAINFLNLAQSQANQNQYLVSQIRPTPIPAYTVPNPFTGTAAATPAA